MSQATLSDRPYVNSNLFSGHYLDERLRERDEWDCDDTASEALSELQALYEAEGELLSEYKEDALVGSWITEVLEILGFGMYSEASLPDSGGFVDELLFENPDARRSAVRKATDADGETASQELDGVSRTTSSPPSECSVGASSRLTTAEARG